MTRADRRHLPIAGRGGTDADALARALRERVAGEVRFDAGARALSADPEQSAKSLALWRLALSARRRAY